MKRVVLLLIASVIFSGCGNQTFNDFNDYEWGTDQASILENEAAKGIKVLGVEDLDPSYQQFVKMDKEIEVNGHPATLSYAFQQTFDKKGISESFEALPGSNEEGMEETKERNKDMPEFVEMDTFGLIGANYTFHDMDDESSRAQLRSDLTKKYGKPVLEQKEPKTEMETYTWETDRSVIGYVYTNGDCFVAYGANSKIHKSILEKYNQSKNNKGEL